MRQGRIVSCGCQKAKRTGDINRKDITGQRFGKLVALEPTDDRSSAGRVIWKCQCDCGNIAYVALSQLTSGLTKSCGCINSYGEFLIGKVLTELHLDYRTQYTFKDLRGKTSQAALRFDFGVFNSDHKLWFLIEFDGEQHFKKFEKWHVPFESDQKKNEYVKTHGIHLLRIDYTHRNYEDIKTIITNYIKELNDETY